MGQCKEKTEVYSRVVGYFRPVSQWNNGKRQEFADRKTFKVDENESSLRRPKDHWRSEGKEA